MPTVLTLLRLTSSNYVLASLRLDELALSSVPFSCLADTDEMCWATEQNRSNLRRQLRFVILLKNS